jgi:hypothetical protein
MEITTTRFAKPRASREFLTSKDAANGSSPKSTNGCPEKTFKASVPPPVKTLPFVETATLPSGAVKNPKSDSSDSGL